MDMFDDPNDIKKKGNTLKIVYSCENLKAYILKQSGTYTHTC